jgi:HSP90 family molecular chaperone
MQRYMKAQSVASGGDGSLGSMNQAVLEINPKHPIVQDLQKMVQNDKESEATKNFAMLMYDVASMTGGYEVSDTGAFASRVMSLMTSKAVDDVEASDEAAETVDDAEDNDKPIEPEVVA